MEFYIKLCRAPDGSHLSDIKTKKVIQANQRKLSEKS